MLHRLIGDGKLGQVVANHLRLHAMPITYPKNSVCLAPEPKNCGHSKSKYKLHDFNRELLGLPRRTSCTHNYKIIWIENRRVYNLLNC
jgi:hypothetical protein